VHVSNRVVVDSPLPRLYISTGVDGISRVKGYVIEYDYPRRSVASAM
jgi:hypothetical protein